jgi:hypothetical protein
MNLSFPLLLIYKDEYRIFEKECPLYLYWEKIGFENIPRHNYFKDCATEYNCNDKLNCKTALFRKHAYYYNIIKELLKFKYKALLNLQTKIGLPIDFTNKLKEYALQGLTFVCEPVKINH